MKERKQKEQRLKRAKKNNVREKFTGNFSLIMLSIEEERDNNKLRKNSESKQTKLIIIIII